MNPAIDAEREALLRPLADHGVQFVVIAWGFHQASRNGPDRVSRIGRGGVQRVSDQNG
jgi:hypothetical protein